MENNPSSKKHWLWIIVVLVLLAIISYAIASKKIQLPQNLLNNQQNTDNKEPVKVSDTLPAGYKTIAPKPGQLPSGFPKNLLLLKDAQIYRGEDTTTNASGENIKITAFYTASTLDQVYSLYQTSLAKDNWALSYQSQTAELGFLSFYKDGNSFLVTITPHQKDGFQSQVELSYSPKK